MYYAISVISGILIAVMIAINGGLTEHMGTYPATVVIHVVGLMTTAAIMLKNRESIHIGKKLPYYCYIGGALGVATTVFNNIAFLKITVSALLALGLLGQSITSIIVDQLGAFHMPKVRFNKKKLIGIAFIVLGIVIMTVPSKL